jgi:hypothetical protein
MPQGLRVHSIHHSVERKQQINYGRRSMKFGVQSNVFYTDKYHQKIHQYL